jgi:hypothetical protein
MNIIDNFTFHILASTNAIKHQWPSTAHCSILLWPNWFRAIAADKGQSRGREDPPLAGGRDGRSKSEGFSASEPAHRGFILLSRAKNWDEGAVLKELPVRQKLAVDYLIIPSDPLPAG